MEFDLNRLLRPHIATLKPYSSARDEYSGKEGIFLDANENPFGSITEDTFNRYPDPYQKDLKARIGEIKGVDSSRIFLGNGSDEAIDLLFRAFCRPGVDNVILLPPTYGMYEVSAGINDVATIKVPLTANFQLDIPAIQAAFTPHSKILFICSPNNPSGNKLNREDIRTLISSFEGLVVVDEAYIDFSDEPSFISELDRYPNLLVMQTFSKAWGLASLRLGMAYASVEIVAILNKIKPPYNVSGLTQSKVLEALQDLSSMHQMTANILSAREHLREGLLKLPSVHKIHPSHANFLLVNIDRPKETYDELVRHKIIVRDRSKVTLCEGCLRITVGTPAENHQLLEVLSQITP
ncbi:histidinol-phosphate transaminase [Lunatimonas salinarum]|uniref:histidinol-phosphate transaminase n=1 Tax=Lunatimonas salinarum TaxID=1774590 RepID=UPI001AE05C18|nr:histidinol-phosphate transaminase [Lunatimonas salinarum]